MNQGSLQLRLLIIAALITSLGLVTFGAFTFLRFKHHASQLIAQELDNHFIDLLASLETQPNGKIILTKKLNDSRFELPTSGLYWQVNTANQAPIRSRSLWDDTLSVIDSKSVFQSSTRELQGPDGEQLIALERSVNISGANGVEIPIIVTIATRSGNITNALAGFLRDILFGLGGLSALLMSGTYLQTKLGLSPLKTLRQAVGKFRSNEIKTLGEDFPLEVAPLVTELNGVFEAREKQLERARNRAGNLAHGLKTPLTVITAIASELEQEGQTSRSEEINSMTWQMRNLVERELARARASSEHGNAKTILLPVVSRVVKALEKTSQNENLKWSVDIAEDAVLPMEAGDVIELLGNLLDNARRYAKSQVSVSYHYGTLTIEDDGPGVDPQKLNAVVKRGVRLDEKGSSGLGLAIVSDLAENYDFEFNIERSHLGGFAAKLKTIL